MSNDTALERTIVSVMADEALGNDPEQAIDLILSTTRRMRPDPRWLALLKEPPMRTSSRVAGGSPNVRLVVILAIVALLLLALAGAIGVGASLLRGDVTSVPSPYGIAANGSLVYEVAGDIYAADATGDHAQAIIAGPEQDSAPRFSHDGTRISFLRQDADQSMRLMVARRDGTGIIELTLFDAVPSTGFNAGPMTGVGWSEWAPADDRLAVFHTNTLGSFISIKAADGNGPAETLDLRCRPPTTCLPGLTKVEPVGWLAWRSSGGELIFTGHPSVGSTDLGLYAIRPDNTGLREIGPVAGNESDSQISFQNPQLTPDGSAIWYWNWEPNAAGVLDGYLHARDLATGQDRRVRLDPSSEGEIIPRFSPDGKSVLFQSRTPSRLIVAPVDGSQPGVPIGPSYSYLDRRGFDFSPDGTKVVLTLDFPPRTLIIDVATGDSVDTAQPMPNVPTWQRTAPAVSGSPVATVPADVLGGLVYGAGMVFEPSAPLPGSLSPAAALARLRSAPNMPRWTFLDRQPREPAIYGLESCVAPKMGCTPGESLRVWVMGFPGSNSPDAATENWVIVNADTGVLISASSSNP